jgi:hypothetical protein
MSSQLQHKFQQFEATPPNDTWRAIEERLDDPSYSLQERLHDYEATPPFTAWNNIAAKLGKHSIHNANTRPIYQTKWFRVAAAAVILGGIALGILNYGVNKPSATIAQQPLVKQAQSSTVASKTPTTTSTTTTSKQTAKSIIPIKEESISVATSTSTKENPSTITKHYKVVATEDGQMVRLSQKAYAVFDCAVKGAAQKSSTCKENIQTMQAKMASSLVSPTTDFAGLIDMIKSLEENN